MILKIGRILAFALIVSTIGSTVYRLLVYGDGFASIIKELFFGASLTVVFVLFLWHLAQVERRRVTATRAADERSDPPE